MFIVSLTYKAELGQVDKFLNEHVDFLKRQYDSGNFILSGRKVPRTGGIIISSIKSKDKLKEVLKRDPFHRESLADYEITEVIPTMSSEELKFLIENH